MTVKIGFAILSYNEPERLFRLVRTLNAIFGEPPIVCHHDFSKCALDETLFSPNVRFVHPHIETRWADMTVVLAALAAFGLLRTHGQPDWFYLISGSDYPVRRADEIIDELSSTNADAYLDNREILRDELPPGQSAECGFGRPEWVALAYERYCTPRIWLPFPSKGKLLSGSFPFRRRYVSVRNRRIHPMIRWLEFNRPSRIYGGDFAFQVNRRAVERILGPSARRVLRYYYARNFPDESLFHTVLCNEADLRISKDNKRYADWSGGNSHPKWIEASDLPKILASGAHFARKFRPDGVVQRFIDETVLGL